MAVCWSEKNYAAVFMKDGDLCPVTTHPWPTGTIELNPDVTEGISE